MKTSGLSELRIEYVPLAEVARWDRNPKKHDLAGLKDLIRRHGFRDAPIFDKTLGAIVAGNGRATALEQMCADGEAPPEGIRIHPKKGWLMPVQLGLDAKTKGRPRPRAALEGLPDHWPGVLSAEEGRERHRPRRGSRDGRQRHRGARAGRPSDAVICDSVLNSVDSLQAERDVVNACSALCKPGGTLFFSGRRVEEFEQQKSFTKITNKVRRRYVEFLDRDGFSGTYKNGVWQFQKYHSKEQALALAERAGDVLAYTTKSMSWQVVVENAARIPAIAADELEASLRREFNFPWPVGCVDRGDAIVDAWRKTVAA